MIEIKRHCIRIVLSNRDKKKIDKGFSIFIDQFGNRDIYTKILLEELFKELYGEIIPLSRQQGQKQCKDSDDTEGKMPTYEIE